MAEYDITYTIRRWDGDQEVDIGFGASGMWSNVDEALDEIHAAIQRRQWETEPGMPDPEEVDGDG